MDGSGRGLCQALTLFLRYKTPFEPQNENVKTFHFQFHFKNPRQDLVSLCLSRSSLCFWMIWSLTFRLRKRYGAQPAYKENACHILLSYITRNFLRGVWTQSYLQIGFRLLSQWFKLFHRNPRHVETKRLLHGCGYGQTFRVSRWRRKTTESHYVFKGLLGSFHSGGRCGLR